MIKSFRHKGLHFYYTKGDASKLRPDLVKRIHRRLRAMNRAKTLEALNIQGFNFHKLKGYKPLRYSIHVNGPFCLTFIWDENGPADIDLVNYH